MTSPESGSREPLDAIKCRSERFGIYANESPAHRIMHPDCDLPLPHGHSLGVIRRSRPDNKPKARTQDAVYRWILRSLRESRRRLAAVLQR